MSVVDQTSSTTIAADALKSAVCGILLEHGFSSATDKAVGVLVGLLEGFLVKLCRLTKAYGENSCRSQPLVDDVIIAAIEIGIDVQSLVTYGRRPYKITLPNPLPCQPSPEPRRFHLGTQLSRPSYIPDYLPEFPDAHCYIRTPTHAAPASGYQNIRELGAVQKRDTMNAMTKFIAKTSDTENLFPDDPYAFPLIASRPKANSVYEACLPKNLEENEAVEDGVGGRWTQQQQQQQVHDDRDRVDSHRLDRTDSFFTPGSSDADNLIDNPFLQPIKMPRVKSALKRSKMTL